MKLNLQAQRLVNEIHFLTANSANYTSLKPPLFMLVNLRGEVDGLIPNLLNPSSPINPFLFFLGDN